MKTRITVVRKACHADLQRAHWNYQRFPKGGPCGLVEEGQSWLIDGWPDMPDGFPCNSAWADIRDDVATVAFGGSQPWMAGDGVAMTCCNDGFRPVSFLVERVDEGEE
ncbi:TIGR04076 family protein [Candidatus Bipolaricaulota bacterium]|nr:TIGR04076 family protein [Candidatus Bipolaricaulota bacterium]